MDKVKLGSQGAVVSRMGLGGMGMSEFYGQRDDAESAATILLVERRLELPSALTHNFCYRERVVASR